MESELSVEITLQQCHQPISDEREQRLLYYQEEIKDSHNSSFVGSVSGQDMKNLWDMGSVEREEMPKSPMHFCIAMEFATHSGLPANLNFKSFEQVPWNSDHEQPNRGNAMNSEFIKHKVNLIIKVS